MRIFQDSCQDIRLSKEDNEWLQRVRGERRGAYILATVGREIDRGIPYEIGGVDNTKLEEIRHMLLGHYNPSIPLDDVTEMYI